MLFVIGTAGQTITVWELSIMRAFERARTDLLTDLMKVFHWVGTAWVIRTLRWSTLLALLFFKRFRHFFVYLASIFLVGFVTTTVALAINRPRPGGIDIIGHWQGSSHPSRPVAGLAVTLLGIAYTLVVAGRPRTWAKWVTTALLFLFGLSRLYLGVDHPTDVLFGVIVGVTIPLVAFRLMTPNDIFPVRYKRGKAAHLDVEGPRGEAIKRAIEEQLGVSITDVQQFSLEGSGGSTPLKLTVSGEPPMELFAKLYATTHLRADRWYKLGRTLLYGRLED
jgi:membrane-associated phospholipid phosphatase